MKQERTRPGVMIYFDDFASADEEMTDEQMGRFIRAVVHYAKDGEWQDFKDDPLLRYALKGAKPKIDRDGEAYNEKILQKSYAGYCSSEKKKGRDPLEYEEWIQQNQQPLTAVDAREHPSTLVNGSQRNQPIAIAFTNANPNASSEGKGCKGKGDEQPLLSVFDDDESVSK